MNCPLPTLPKDPPRVLLGHGGGGRLMHDLIAQVFGAAFSNPFLDRRHDAAVLPALNRRLAFTTDSYVVRPLFFPGGDVGSMAVHGTVNDLAMAGARPLYLSAAFILEEGLPMEVLRRVVASMGEAARRCGVFIVTGDTKVVEAGKADGLYINTAGVGVLEHERTLEPASVEAGDVVLVSGDIGRHGMAVMAVREGLEFESAIESDSAPVVEPVLALLEAGVPVHCVRDLTRGGLGGALVEIAETVELEIRIEDALVPVRGDVAAACEMLGLEPFQVACEGRWLAMLPEEDLDRALEVLRRHASDDAGAPVRIGRVARRGGGPGRVIARGSLGGERVLRMPAGEQLPRIC